MEILGQSHRVTRARALSLIELLVILAIIAVLTALLLPALVGAKSKSQPINCPARLKQIGLAFLTWSVDNDNRLPMRVTVTNGGTKEIHGKRGHIAFGDGRVDSFSNGGVGAAIKVGDGTTNWLAVP